MKKFMPLCLALMLPVFSASAEVKLSERLTKIAGHLGDGGVHFSVTDSKDDLKKLGQLVDQILTYIPDAEIPPGLKVEELFEDLGLYSIEGRGASSHQVGELWHNRSFVLTDGNHSAALSLLGDEAKTPAAYEFAPAGADLILETSLDLRQVERTANKLAKAFGRGAQQEIGGVMKEQMTTMGLSLADIFVDFTVRGTLVAWLDEEKTFELNPGIQLPVPHLAARLDNASIVWKLLKSELGEASDVTTKGGDMILIPKNAKEETPFGPLEPRFVWNEDEQALFFSFTEADLAVCRGDGARIGSSPDFKRATVGLPEKGNGLAYASKDLFALVVELAKIFSPQVPPEAAGIVEGLLPYVEKMAANGGYAAAYAVEKDGFLFAANLPYPVKGESNLMGISAVATIAALSKAGFDQAILKAKDSADDTKTLISLKAFAGAQAGYRSDKGKFAASLAQLVEHDWIDEQLAQILTAAEMEIVIEVDYVPRSSRDILAVAKAQKSPGSVLVARADGSAATMTLEEMERQLAKQK